MKRKPKALRVRNHLAVHAIKRKAGAHRKSEKAQRRSSQVEHLRGVAHWSSSRLLTDRSQFDSVRPYHFFHKAMSIVLL